MTTARVEHFLPTGEIEHSVLSHETPDATIWYTIENGEHEYEIHFIHPDKVNADLNMHVTERPEGYKYVRPIPKGTNHEFTVNGETVLYIHHTPLSQEIQVNLNGRLAIG